ncbi:ribosomal-protein-alanine N-acetyltransferase [Evansella caseinilytica]|uniref:Ribosomal-protein-alanine N-acetyltransferase n=1 Tax=Evansella caseinilytica TaxID=1503961 RepID=A0A1H3U674_9BACI|nr:GNAT family N-acetyltransferase [Evansella caseinilytica]SDZ57973.1 ribosomal-protein-alanine N-acetyltransferase [Evansella caseinilytica]
MENEQVKDGVFETEHLIFRSLTMADTPAIYSLYSDPLVIRLDQSERMQTLKEAAALIQAAEQAKYDPRVLHWGVEWKAANKIVGTGGFKHWDRIARHAEIGGCVSREFMGRGLATEGLAALLEYGFTTMSLNKIYGLTNEKNIRALRIMKKFGFRQEGRLREHQLLDGCYSDVLLYSLLQKQYFSDEKQTDC